MKLHRKRNKINKWISMALVCCMTFSMGSSYVNAGEPGSAVAESETIPESGEAEEFVPAQTKGADNQGAVQNVGGEADNDASSDSSENGNPDDGNGEQAGGKLNGHDRSYCRLLD